MNALAVLPRVPVKHGVLVPRQHLRLGRHLSLPPLDGLDRLAPPGQRGVDRGHDVVDGPQAEPLPALLEAGHAPGDLPEEAARERARHAEGAEHFPPFFLFFFPQSFLPFGLRIVFGWARGVGQPWLFRRAFFVAWVVG